VSKNGQVHEENSYGAMNDVNDDSGMVEKMQGLDLGVNVNSRRNYLTVLSRSIENNGQRVNKKSNQIHIDEEKELTLEEAMEKVCRCFDLEYDALDPREVVKSAKKRVELATLARHFFSSSHLLIEDRLIASGIQGWYDYMKEVRSRDIVITMDSMPYLLYCDYTDECSKSHYEKKLDKWIYKKVECEQLVNSSKMNKIIYDEALLSNAQSVAELERVVRAKWLDITGMNKYGKWVDGNKVELQCYETPLHYMYNWASFWLQDEELAQIMPEIVIALQSHEEQKNL